MTIQKNTSKAMKSRHTCDCTNLIRDYMKKCCWEHHQYRKKNPSSFLIPDCSYRGYELTLSLNFSRTKSRRILKGALNQRGAVTINTFLSLAGYPPCNNNNRSCNAGLMYLSAQLTNYISVRVQVKLYTETLMINAWSTQGCWVMVLCEEEEREKINHTHCSHAEIILLKTTQG